MTYLRQTHQNLSRSRCKLIYNVVQSKVSKNLDDVERIYTNNNSFFLNKISSRKLTKLNEPQVNVRRKKKFVQ